MEQPPSEKLPEEQPLKKEKYEAPRLWRYGTLTEITQASGTSAAHKDKCFGSA